MDYPDDGELVGIDIPTDADGHIDRECPECHSVFKIRPGTGLPDSENCTCPYCGHTGQHDAFVTESQKEYAESVVMHEVSAAFLRGLKNVVREWNRTSPKGFVTMTWTVEGQPTPVTAYRSPELETRVTCESCHLEYKIFGVFAFCPDCGRHNSAQMLLKNLEIAERQLALAQGTDPDLARQLVEDALENAVGAFDGFGRETCRVAASASTSPARAEDVHFQNLEGARKNVADLFGADLASSVSRDEWSEAIRCFQKRHLLAHKMGVVDDEYLAKANDPGVTLGRRVSVTAAEVAGLLAILRKLGLYLVAHIGL